MSWLHYSSSWLPAPFFLLGITWRERHGSKWQFRFPRVIEGTSVQVVTLVFVQELSKLLPFALWLLVFPKSFLPKLLLRKGLCIGVQSQHHLLVVQRVLFLDTSSLRHLVSLWLLQDGL